MKLSKLVLVAVFVGSLGVLGCGDDGSGGGSGGGNPCDACTARQNECDEAYNVCVAENTGAAQEDCPELALLACEVQ